jgi:sugar phosphate isomerase/epimerase
MPQKKDASVPSATRRGFLLSTGALAAGLGVSLTALAEPLPEQGSALAVRITSYGKFQDAAWEHLPGIGVHYLFLPVPKPEEVDALMQKLEKSGLKALVVRGDTDWSKDDCVDKLAGQLAVCEKMGVRFMFLSVKCNGAPKEAVYERLRKAGDAARKHNVTLTFETHPELGTNGDVQLETMAAVNHPNVRVNFDTANVYFYNKGIDGVAELRKIRDYVAAVHLKDTSGEFHGWHFPALGRGIVDFRQTFAVLAEIGFHGPFTLEIEGFEGEEKTERLMCDRIAESLGYLRGLGVLR